MMTEDGAPVTGRTAYDVRVDADGARRAVVDAGRRLGTRGLIAAGEGNLSYRLADGRLLVTPSGARKDELSPDDLVIVDPAEPGRREPPDARPTSDLAIHLAVAHARPDVRAIAHAHLPAAMALTLAGELPDPAALPETALLLPVVPLVALGIPGSDDLAARIAAAFAAGESLPHAVLLERHGAVAVGATPAAAVDRLDLLEVLCRTWRDALLIRAARVHLDHEAIPASMA
jgi:L-fuculose-phosphate aldolase